MMTNVDGWTWAHERMAKPLALMHRCTTRRFSPERS